jgi:Flp pilus assembly pilin Flp
MFARFLSAVRRFRVGDQGLAITEYGLLIACLAVVIIGVVVLFGGGIASWFGSRTSTITTN